MNPAAKVGESEKQATEEPSNELIVSFLKYNFIIMVFKKLFILV
jgi:hypothetical protein